MMFLGPLNRTDTVSGIPLTKVPSSCSPKCTGTFEMVTIESILAELLFNAREDSELFSFATDTNNTKAKNNEIKPTIQLLSNKLFFIIDHLFEKNHSERTL